MEQSGGCHHLCLPFLLFGCLVLCSFQGANGYQNYTVGDSLGWYDKLEVAKVDYQAWASGKNFSLGDFLIFNTDRNHSVVQTYNHTTYRQCNIYDAEDDDTVEWSAGPPTFDKSPVTLKVPLVKEGPNYFFSGDYDGEQCKNGQRFKITVLHGQGLPKSLKTPAAAESQAPTSPADDGSVPDTTVPANFNNPKEVGNVQETSGGGRLEGWLGMVLFWGFAWAEGMIL